MKNTGVVRRLDELGRITLPMELRKVFGIEERDSLEIYVEDDKIILKKPLKLPFKSNFNSIYAISFAF